MQTFTGQFSAENTYSAEFLEADTIIASLLISEDHPHMDGHFDGFKIFPAVSQLGIVLDLLSKKFDRKISLSKIKRAKFLNMLRPSCKLEIKIKLLSEEGTARWEVKDETKCYSKGLLTYV